MKDTPISLLAEGVINRAAKDVLDQLSEEGHPIPHVTREDALYFFHSASQDGPESIWFRLAGISPDQALERVLAYEE